MSKAKVHDYHRYPAKNTAGTSIANGDGPSALVDACGRRDWTSAQDAGGPGTVAAASDVHAAARAAADGQTRVATAGRDGARAATASSTTWTWCACARAAAAVTATASAADASRRAECRPRLCLCESRRALLEAAAARDAARVRSATKSTPV